MKLEKAQGIAQGVVDRLSPFCEHCLIAGSVRRLSEDVKDIEIVVCRYGQGGMVISLASVIRQLGNVVKGDPVNGRYVKIHSFQGIMVDLFLPQPFDFWRIFAIRTGSRSYSQNVIARGWNLKGWVGTADGLRLELESQRHGKAGVWKCMVKDPHLPPVWTSEEDFFEWLGVPYLEPQYRGQVAEVEFDPVPRAMTIQERIDAGHFTPKPENDGQK